MYMHAYIDDALFIGIMTKTLLNKGLNDGDITPRQVEVFYQAVRCFFVTAVKYALDHLPFKDAVLENASFVNIESRDSCHVSQLAYFVTRLV